MTGSGPASDGALEFSYSAIEQELNSLPKLAARYLDKGTEQVVARAISELRNASLAGTRSISWEISREFPIKTAASDGGYQIGMKGAISVRAELSFLWEIANVVPGADAKGQTPKKTKRAHQFRVCGNASSVVSIFDVEKDEHPIAKWHFDLAAHDAPGCFFHVQVAGNPSESMFPSSLDVPRLPSLLVTPMDALEFVLGELFQEDWAKQSNLPTNPHLATWRGYQTKRLNQILRWKQEVVMNNSNATPWSALKAAKPPRDLFGDEKGR